MNISCLALERYERHVGLQDHEMEIGTRASASNRRASSTFVMANASNEEHIEQLQAEIDRLKSQVESARSTRSESAESKEV